MTQSLEIFIILYDCSCVGHSNIDHVINRTYDRLVSVVWTVQFYPHRPSTLIQDPPLFDWYCGLSLVTEFEQKCPRELGQKGPRDVGKKGPRDIGYRTFQIDHYLSDLSNWPLSLGPWPRSLGPFKLTNISRTLTKISRTLQIDHYLSDLDQHLSDFKRSERSVATKIFTSSGIYILPDFCQKWMLQGIQLMLSRFSWRLLF